MGGAHGESILARWDTQISWPPKPPWRSELKYRLSPSFVTAGPRSMLGELTTAPRFTGSDHDEYFGAAKARRAIRTTAIRTFRIEAIVVPFWARCAPFNAGRVLQAGVFIRPPQGQTRRHNPPGVCETKFFG